VRQWGSSLSSCIQLAPHPPPSSSTAAVAAAAGAVVVAALVGSVHLVVAGLLGQGPVGFADAGLREGGASVL